MKKTEWSARIRQQHLRQWLWRGRDAITSCQTLSEAFAKAANPHFREGGWGGAAVLHTNAAVQFLPSSTLIGERRVEGAQFNFPSQAAGNRNLDVTDPPAPTDIHNSPLVMCVLNTAEIYMGAICKFGKGLEETTRWASESRRRPPFLDRTL